MAETAVSFVVHVDDVAEVEGQYPAPFDGEKLSIYRDLGAYDAQLAATRPDRHWEAPRGMLTAMARFSLLVLVLGASAGCSNPGPAPEAPQARREAREPPPSSPPTPIGGGDASRAEGPRVTSGDAAPGASSAVSAVVGVDGVAGYDALTSEQREALRRRRIFWGHQSVGQNIIDGARALGFDMIEIHRAGDYDRGAWGEAGVADNGDPERKIASFDAIMNERGVGRLVEAAGFKFCWVDFERDTDVDGLLADYEARMDALAARFPRVRFLHVTPPLTTGDADKNAVRWRYGRALLRRHDGRGVVFDLASVISTEADGAACTASGTRRLCPSWASDEGHLNDAGARRAAKAFVYSFHRLLAGS